MKTFFIRGDNFVYQTLHTRLSSHGSQLATLTFLTMSHDFFYPLIAALGNCALDNTKIGKVAVLTYCKISGYCGLIFGYFFGLAR